MDSSYKFIHQHVRTNPMHNALSPNPNMKCPLEHLPRALFAAMFDAQTVL